MKILISVSEQVPYANKEIICTMHIDPNAWQRDMGLANAVIWELARVVSQKVTEEMEKGKPCSKPST